MSKKAVFKEIFITVCICLSVLVPVFVFSQPVETEKINTEIKKSRQDALDHAKKRAAEWGVTVKEWTRYQAIIKGPRGVWSPGLDPIVTLGIAAETEAERKRYAELFVRMEYAKVERELAFQAAVDAAWHRLYPDNRKVDLTSKEAIEKNKRIAAGKSPEIDKYAVVVSKKCPECEVLLDKKLQTMIDESSNSVDLFIVGIDNPGKTREWLKRRPAILAAAKAGKVKLKSAPAEFEKIKRFPAVFKRVKNEGWHRVL